MTSIHSLPPELLHQIFHWATYDYALSAELPSWKHYTLYHLDGGEDPWPMLYLGMERERTIPALRLTCTRWTAIATEFELHYLIIHDVPKLKYYLGRIRRLLEKHGEGENNVKCPVRILNLRVIKGTGRVWTEEDTEMVVSLIRDCPNLEFMVNWCYTEGEVLEIMYCPPAAADEPPPTPAPLLELPSLHCLQVSVDDDNASLAAVIAEQWRLPSLTSLYLQSTYKSTFTLQKDPGITFSPSATSLIATHGQSVDTLAIDRWTACHIPLHILPPAPIHELVYYMYGLQKSTSLPFTAVSTLVLLIDMDKASPLTTAIWRALEQLRRLQDYSLPQLKKVVILSWPLDDLKGPHPIDNRVLDETERLLVDPWHQETPSLVNRNGVRLLTLVGTNQG
ncbi:hypothetical protein FS837_012318 [Tulasnella sp. UAMH 9824]|nr:hypothetical protein FS837_012318 [Tulasnella sp. UAMH 9824]